MLDRKPLNAERLQLVQQFSCGDEPWAKQIAEYLKDDGPAGAVAHMAAYGNQAWLYIDDSNAVVGYGVLGFTNWRWPDPNKRAKYLHIPAFGVDARFQGQPAGARERRYSRRIFLDIMRQAQRTPSMSRLLTLFVDERNTKAIGFYEDFRFDRIPEINYLEGEAIYLAMAARLP